MHPIKKKLKDIFGLIYTPRMPNKRSAGQKGVLIMMDEAFRNEIDAALPKTGFDDRSAFIRNAVYEKMREIGVNISSEIKSKPSRVGKGGRNATSTHGLALVAETSGNNNTVTFPSTSQSVRTPAKYPAKPRGKKKPKK